LLHVEQPEIEVRPRTAERHGGVINREHGTSDSVSRLVGLPLRNPDGLEDTKPGMLTKEEGVCAAAAATPLLTEMRGIILEQAAEHLDSWLEKALQGDVAEVAIFAAGVRRERAEPVAALDLTRSRGPTEGRITRLKLVKGKGYGWPAWRRSNGASSTPPDHAIC
jgi:hypothetical protein